MARSAPSSPSSAGFSSISFTEKIQGICRSTEKKIYKIGRNAASLSPRLSPKPKQKFSWEASPKSTPSPPSTPQSADTSTQTGDSLSARRPAPPVFVGPQDRHTSLTPSSLDGSVIHHINFERDSRNDAWRDNTGAEQCDLFTSAAANNLRKMFDASNNTTNKENEVYSFLGDPSSLGPDPSIIKSPPKEATIAEAAEAETPQHITTHTSTRQPLAPQIINGNATSIRRKPVTAQTQNGSPLKLFDNYNTFTNETMLKHIRGFESDKRPSSSPAKEPTPKRRRTLHKSDIDFENFNSSSLNMDDSSAAPALRQASEPSSPSAHDTELDQPRKTTVRFSVSEGVRPSAPALRVPKMRQHGQQEMDAARVPTRSSSRAARSVSLAPRHATQEKSMDGFLRNASTVYSTVSDKSDASSVVVNHPIKGVPDHVHLGLDRHARQISTVYSEASQNSEVATTKQDSGRTSEETRTSIEPSIHEICDDLVASWRRLEMPEQDIEIALFKHRREWEQAKKKNAPPTVTASGSGYSFSLVKKYLAPHHSDPGPQDLTLQHVEDLTAADDVETSHDTAKAVAGPAQELTQTPTRPLVQRTNQNQMQMRPVVSKIIEENVGNMSLSPLPDFTAHNNEKSFGLEVSYVAGDKHLVTGDGSKQIMSLTVKDLVAKITAKEPRELDWDDMQELDLSNNAAKSFHMLDKFCPKLIKFDGSDNEVHNLDGIPAGVLELRIPNNLLSDLTSWGHLVNLQRIDVSNNPIKTLTPFGMMPHLQSLVADNTGLTSLKGIRFNCNLRFLSVRNNALNRLDFEETNLRELVSLDVERNNIIEVKGLHMLRNLATLNLKHNTLHTFQVERAAKTIKFLTLSDNNIARADLRNLPGLKVLYADRNKLTEIHNLDKVNELDTLTLREQQGCGAIGLQKLLQTAFDIRKLFLSGNHLDVHHLSAPRDMLNLQVLDIANCGLTSMDDKLDQMMLNVRTLVLNYNALTDLTPLVGMARLRRLYLVKNRIKELYNTAFILSHFPHLEELDLRDNPLTLGFYPHMVQGRTPKIIEPGKNKLEQAVAVCNGNHEDSMMSEDIDLDIEENPFVLPDEDAHRDAQYQRRLDMDTRVERRTYERKLVHRCSTTLQKVDGLILDRGVRALRDGVFREMEKKGLVRKVPKATASAL